MSASWPAVRGPGGWEQGGGPSLSLGHCGGFGPWVLILVVARLESLSPFPGLGCEAQRRARVSLTIPAWSGMEQVPVADPKDIMSPRAAQCMVSPAAPLSPPTSPRADGLGVARPPSRIFAAWDQKPLGVVRGLAGGKGLFKRCLV